MIKRPARHTKSSFYDQQAIGIVSALIAGTQRAMPDLKANDKWPNIDGYIEVIDEKGFPNGTLKVQVKKLSIKNAKKKQHSFKNDKFLSYCRESMDWIPILFIGVDLQESKAFWLHIDHDFLSKNGNKKTIKLKENQVIESGNSNFIKDWENIIALYCSKADEFEKYKKAFSILSDIITPALGKADNQFIKIHYFLDEINSYLDYKYSIVKQIFYPKTWKLGLAYYQYEKSKLVYTLYPIPQNRNDVQIKEVDKNLHDKIQEEGLGFTGHFFENPVETQPKEYAKEIINSKVKKIIEAKLLNHSGSEFLAKEFIFAFIDKFYIQMGLEQRNEYLISEIEEAFHRYLPFWLKISYDLLFSEDRNNFKARVSSGSIRYYDPDRIGEIKEEELKEIKQKIEEILKKNTPVPQIRMRNEQFSFRIFMEFFNFLKQSKKEIVRPYKAKNFSRLKNGNNSDYNTFSKNDLKSNLKIFFDNLIDTYEVILKNNFPMLKNELSLFGEADTILISWNEKDIYYPQDFPTYDMCYLQSREKREHGRIFLLEGKNIRKTPVKNIIFREKEYQFISRKSAILDFIYEDTPMLNFIYKEIEDLFNKNIK